jgi:acyl-coenzyme A thioesterase PaaI-like protein
MHVRERLLIRLFSLKIPVLMFLGPRLVEVDEDGCAIEIPLRWRSRNHLGSMYFGALCAGADVAGGLLAVRLISARHRRVSLVFADVKAEFLKRADGDVRFRCRDGRRIAEAVRQADETGERVGLPVEVVATVPSRYGDEPVARFTLGLSLKRADGPSVESPPAPDRAGATG